MPFAAPEARDKVIRTILGEAAGEGPEGWRAAAWVLRNRHDDGRWGGSFNDIITPSQFSAWNPKDKAYRLTQTDASDPLYQRIGAIVDGVFDDKMPDPTRGATHYHTNAVNPDWDKDMQDSVQIGAHKFGRIPGGRAPMQQPESSDTPRSPYTGQGVNFRSGVDANFTNVTKAMLGDLGEKFQAAGLPLNVISGYRSPGHNEAVGGAKGSQHMHGTAIDIDLKSLSPEQQKQAWGIILASPHGKEFGYYPNSNSIHLDAREGNRVAWGQNRSSSSIGQGWQPWQTEMVTQWRSNAPGAGAAGTAGTVRLANESMTRAYDTPSQGDPGLRRGYEPEQQQPIDFTVKPSTTTPAAPAGIATMTPGDKARALSDPTRYGVSPETVAYLRGSPTPGSNPPTVPPGSGATPPAQLPPNGGGTGGLYSETATPQPPARPTSLTTPEGSGRIPERNLPLAPVGVEPAPTGLFNPQPLSGNNTATPFGRSELPVEQRGVVGPGFDSKGTRSRFAPQAPPAQTSMLAPDNVYAALQPAAYTNMPPPAVPYITRMQNPFGWLRSLFG